MDEKSTKKAPQKRKKQVISTFVTPDVLEEFKRLTALEHKTTYKALAWLVLAWVNNKRAKEGKDVLVPDDKP